MGVYCEKADFGQISPTSLNISVFHPWVRQRHIPVPLLASIPLSLVTTAMDGGSAGFAGATSRSSPIPGQPLIKQNCNSLLIMDNKFYHLQPLSRQKPPLFAARQRSATGGVEAPSQFINNYRLYSTTDCLRTR